MGTLHICNGKELRRYGSKNIARVCQCDIKDKENFIYTDGSLNKGTGQGGYGVYSHGLNIQMKNPCTYWEHQNNILRLESKAILEAVKHVKEKYKTHDRFDIFTDSENVLTHLQLLLDGEEPSLDDDNDGLGQRILDEINDKNWPVQVHMHKVKAHAGVPGNETADKFAKEAASRALKAGWGLGCGRGRGRDRDNHDDEGLFPFWQSTDLGSLGAILGIRKLAQEFAKIAVNIILKGDVAARGYAKAASALQITVDAVDQGVKMLRDIFIRSAQSNLSAVQMTEFLKDLGFHNETRECLVDYCSQRFREIRGLVAVPRLNVSSYRKLEWRLDVQLGSRSLFHQTDPSFLLKLSLNREHVGGVPSFGGKQSQSKALNNERTEKKVIYLEANYAILKTISSQLEQALAERGSSRSRRILQQLQ